MTLKHKVEIGSKEEIRRRSRAKRRDENSRPRCFITALQ
jgi:hypothetical protein